MGISQVIVGTSLGFIYVVDADGNTRSGFPVQVTAPIHLEVLSVLCDNVLCY